MMSLIAAVVLSGGAPATLYDFTVQSIDDKPVPLKKFRDKALVIVNVASRCGLTPQYEGLQALYTKYQKQGLEVLGFPANNFGGQEPGTNEEIKEFCSTKFNVTFPMFAKVSVKGGDTAPLFKWLIERSDRPKEEIEWNFAKFVVNRKGEVIARFSPRVSPTAPEFIAAIEKALEK